MVPDTIKNSIPPFEGIVQQGSGHLEGGTLSLMEATAHIRSQTCSSVMHFGIQGIDAAL